MADSSQSEPPKKEEKKGIIEKIRDSLLGDMRILGALLSGWLSLLGMLSSWSFYNVFDIDIFNFAEPSDFLLMVFSKANIVFVVLLGISLVVGGMARLLRIPVIVIFLAASLIILLPYPLLFILLLLWFFAESTKSCILWICRFIKSCVFLAGDTCRESLGAAGGTFRKPCAAAWGIFQESLSTVWRTFKESLDITLQTIEHGSQTISLLGRKARGRYATLFWRYSYGLVVLGLLLLLPPGPAIGQTDEEIEKVFWESVECESKLQVEAYLEGYPTGRYVAEAWACLEGQLGLGRAARVLVQQGLTALDYAPGPADGLFGPATRRAIRAWQEMKEFAATGYLPREQAGTLMAQGRDAVAAQRPREAARQQAEAEQERREAGRRRAQEAARPREAARQQRQPGETFRDCPTCPELVVVPAGSYRMGSPSHEEGRGADEGPVHRVRIEQPFAVGVYEVTFGDWERCESRGGCEGYWPDDEGWGHGQRPVINVSWEDAQTYVRWLSQETGKGYRLLSEAEWEYVARAGTTTRYWWGNEVGRNRANCTGCGSQWEEKQTAPVGSFRPNTFGLYDVHGNVWEWVWDCWNERYAGAPRDGRAWEGGECGHRVLRGGSWRNRPSFCRSASRLGSTADNRNDVIGFRIARSLP